MGQVSWGPCFPFCRSRWPLHPVWVSTFWVSKTAAPSAEPGIQDNSFLVEEAYNQNFGVVQHISSFTRFWDSKDWNYSFTQEWPVPGNERHQLSYTPGGFSCRRFS